MAAVQCMAAVPIVMTGVSVLSFARYVVVDYANACVATSSVAASGAPDTCRHRGFAMEYPSCKRVDNKAKQAALGGRHPKNGCASIQQ